MCTVYLPFLYCIDYRRSERVGPFTRICRPDRQILVNGPTRSRICRPDRQILVNGPTRSDRRNQYNMRMVYRPLHEEEEEEKKSTCVGKS